MSLASQFYHVGGALAADVPSYVMRAADDELYQKVWDGKFCYVLTTRQMGKTSLMDRTAERLRTEGAHVAIIDLTGIGGDEKSVSADQWYYGIVDALRDELGLDEGLVNAWWEQRGKLPALQRLVRFLRDVVLAKTDGRVVVFVDEIDTTLNLSFADDFFAGIRACFNARARDAEFGRLTFVLLGVASPTDLIADPLRTPFNIGTRVDLADFRRDEARTLAEGLGGKLADRELALDRVLFWTDGHPYLTQKVCLLAAESSRDRISPADIDRIIEKTFLAPGADRNDDNLKFVRSRVAGRGNVTRRLLKLYRRVLRGDRVVDVPTSAIHNELKLAGLVKARDDGTLIVRNAIYRRVFGESWIKEVRPPADNWKRATGAACILLLLSPGFWYEVIYPRQFVYILNKATGEEANLADDAYKRLRRVPFYGQAAEDHWIDYNRRRAQWAIDLDEQRNRHQDAFRAARSVHLELSTLPGFRQRSDELCARFFERRALREARAERRDEAILWRLKALTIVPGRDDLRKAVSQLVNPDYALLKRTIRAPEPLVQSDDQLRKPAIFERTGAASDSQQQFGELLSAALAPFSASEVPTRDPSAGYVPTGVFDVPAPIRPQAFSAHSLDGRRLALASWNGRVQIWDLEQLGAEPLTLGGPIGRVTAAAMSPTGNYLLMVMDKDARLWRLDQPAKEPAVLRLVAKPGGTPVFSPDGSRVVIEGGPGTVQIWWSNRPTAEPVALKVARQLVHKVAFSPNGSRLLVLSYDPPHPREYRPGHSGPARVVQVWRTDQLLAEPSYLTGPVSAITDVAFSADGTRIICVDDSFRHNGALEETMRIWRADQLTSEPIIVKVQARERVNHAPESGLIAFSPDGSRLATRSVAGGDTVRLWNLDKLGAPSLLGPDADGYITALAFSADGSRICASLDGSVYVWRVEQPGAAPYLIRAHDRSIYKLAFGVRGTLLITLDTDTTARLWGVDDLVPPPENVIGRNGAIGVVTLSRDGSHLATIVEDGRVWLWSVDQQGSRPLHLSTKPVARIRCAIFSDDGQQLFVAGADGTPRRWWVNRGRDPAVEFHGNTSPVQAMAVSPDGAWLVAACLDYKARLWRLDRPSYDPIILRPRAEHQHLLSPAFSPDGKIVALSGTTGTWLWKVDHFGEEPVHLPLALMPSDFAETRLAAFSPDSNSLIDVDPAGPAVIRRVDKRDDAPLNLLLGRGTRALAFSPDGSSIFTATRTWGHLARFDGATLTPVASRPLPYPYASHSPSNIRFLDTSGSRIQIIVQPTADCVLSTTLRFDIDADAPIEGDPETLLADWQKKLALKIADDGEIVPAN
jgi:WD40 repeat protein